MITIVESIVFHFASVEANGQFIGVQWMNKKPTNCLGRAKRRPLKFDPKPSAAAFSAVSFELR